MYIHLYKYTDKISLFYVKISSIMIESVLFVAFRSQIPECLWSTRVNTWWTVGSNSWSIGLAHSETNTSMATPTTINFTFQHLSSPVMSTTRTAHITSTVATTPTWHPHARLLSILSSKVVAQELYVITSAAPLFNSCSERGQETVDKIEFVAESSTWAHRLLRQPPFRQN